MYETLLQEALEERIEIIYWPLRGRLKGLYCDQTIAINTSIVTSAERTGVLAEELGHYHTTVGEIIDQSILNNRKQERRARTWSYQRLMPLEKLIEAYKARVKTRHDLAEFLGLTEQFIEEALIHCKEKHGLYCRVREYWICFEPLAILEIRQQELKPAENEAGFVLY